MNSRGLTAAVYTLLALMLPRPSHAQGQTWHLETEDAKRYRATAQVTVTYPNLLATEWVVCATKPPILSGQKNTTLTLSLHDAAIGAEQKELSPLCRPVILARLPVGDDPVMEHSATLTLTYEVTVLKRKLVAGRPHTLIPPLSAAERTAGIAADATCDYDAPPFQDWLDANGLRRRAKESDLDFAYRVFQCIKGAYTYDYQERQERRASSLCQVKATDCGGTITLFVAALKANGIPAHELVGRWLYSGKTDEFGEGRHVKSEFFAKGIGWVPVEMAGVLGKPDSADADYFGSDTDSFLTTHIGTDLMLDIAPWGKQTVQWAQVLRWWVVNAGGEDRPLVIKETWKVEPVKPATARTP